MSCKYLKLVPSLNSLTSELAKPLQNTEEYGNYNFEKRFKENAL